MAQWVCALLWVCSFLLSACQEKTEKLMLYTSLPERDTQVIVSDFKRTHPGVDLSFFRSGTNEIMTKIKTELLAGNPKADLLMIADDVMMEDLKAGGHLAKLSDVDVTDFPETGYDKDRMYFGIAMIGTGLVCHRDFKPKSTSLHALTSAEMKDKVCMASPVFSGSAAVTLSLVALQPELGWKFWEAFKRNNPLLVKGNGGVLETVTKKGRMCGFLADFMALNAMKEGAGLTFHYFDEGTPVIHHPVAILKQSQKQEKAKLFVNYMLSKQGQKKLVELGYKPLRSDVKIPETFQTLSGFKEMEGSSKDILKRMDKDRKAFSKHD